MKTRFIVEPSESGHNLRFKITDTETGFSFFSKNPKRTCDYLNDLVQELEAERDSYQKTANALLECIDKAKQALGVK